MRSVDAASAGDNESGAADMGAVLWEGRGRVKAAYPATSDGANQVRMLRDKVVIVTGSGTGVGRAYARGFAAAGAKVVGISRTESDLQETQRACAPGTFEYVVGDVSRAEDVEKLFALAERKLGPVDILVNNAAVYPKVEFLQGDIEAFQRDLLVNVMGVARTCHRALPSMLQRGFGRVVNVGSFAFLGPIPRASLYSTSKGAASALTRSIAVEIDERRFPDVRVNELMPGVFRTRMTPDQGEDPAVAFAYLEPVVTIPSGGPHGRIFDKGKLHNPGGGGLKGKLKRIVKRALGG